MDGVTFNLFGGKTLALVGESGSGKTTTGKSLLQLIPATAGRVVYQGNDINKIFMRHLRALRTDLQLILQDPYAAMNPRMIIGDVIAEGMTTLGIVKNEQEKHQRIDTLLQQVGLPLTSKYRYPHEFSGGQRQRI